MNQYDWRNSGISKEKHKRREEELENEFSMTEQSGSVLLFLSKNVNY